MYKKIKLDLHKDFLFGWEGVKEIDEVEEYMTALRNGAVFPQVHVAKLNQGYPYYALLPNRQRRGKYGVLVADGGHRRAAAHYIQRVPLRCLLHKEDLPEIARRNLTILIPKIVLASEGEQVCTVENYVVGKPREAYTDSDKLILPF